MMSLLELLETYRRDSEARDERLAQSIEDILRKQEIDGQVVSLQAQTEVLSRWFQGASTYSNLIIIGGYASILAIWQLTQDYLTRKESLVVGSLVLTSVLLFAGFEVYKMIAQALFLGSSQKCMQLDRG